MPNTENHSLSAHLGHSSAGRILNSLAHSSEIAGQKFDLTKAFSIELQSVPITLKGGSQCKQWHIRELQFHNSYPLIHLFFSVVSFKHLYSSTKPNMHCIVSKAQRHLCLIRQRHIRFQQKIDSRCDPPHLSIKNNVS